MAKLTKNGQSLQIVIPSEIYNRYGWKHCDNLEFVPMEEGVLLKRSSFMPMVTTKVYTIGYEGRSMDNFVNMLQIHGIKQVIDVRELASSRKPGFSKTALKSKLEDEEISYRHIPELGSPSDVRHTYKEGGSLTIFREEYSAYLDTKKEAFDELRGFVLSKQSAIMCFEKSAVQCHRKVLADRLDKEGFRLTHL